MQEYKTFENEAFLYRYEKLCKVKQKVSLIKNLFYLNSIFFKFKKRNIEMEYLTKFVDEDFDDTISKENNLKDLKRLRLWDKRFDEISRDIGVFLMFLVFLYYVSFSSLSDSSYIYNELFQTTFVQAQNPTEKGLDEVSHRIVLDNFYNFKFYFGFSLKCVLVRTDPISVWQHRIKKLCLTNVKVVKT